LEAAAANALVLIELALRLFGAGAHRLVVLAVRNPLAATAAVGGLLWWCYHRGYLARNNWRRRLSRVGEATVPLLELASAGVAEHQTISDSLVVVVPPAYSTTEQLAARYLWKSGAGNVDVHYSSGIANHFFYLLSEGSGKKEINGVYYDSPTADGQPAATRPRRSGSRP
jgi:hypothetical protein